MLRTFACKKRLLQCLAVDIHTIEVGGSEHICKREARISERKKEIKSRIAATYESK